MRYRHTGNRWGEQHFPQACFIPALCKGLHVSFEEISGGGGGIVHLPVNQDVYAYFVGKLSVFSVSFAASMELKQEWFGYFCWQESVTTHRCCGYINDHDWEFVSELWSLSLDSG